MLNRWYRDRLFHTRSQPFRMLTPTGEMREGKYVVESRVIYSVTLCCTRPINEIMPIPSDGFVQQIKAVLFNTHALRSRLITQD